MHDFVKIGTLDELKDHGQFSRWSNNHDVLVYRWKEEIKAISNICPHFGGPVGFHRLKDGKFTCLWHNFEFSAETRECVYGIKARLREYQVQIIENDIFIRLQEDSSND